jgi:hypothetical protein
MIGDRIRNGELDIGLTGRWRRDHNFLRSADGSRPGFAENSRYSFLQTVTADREATGLPQLSIDP